MYYQPQGAQRPRLPQYGRPSMPTYPQNGGGMYSPPVPQVPQFNQPQPRPQYSRPGGQFVAQGGLQFTGGGASGGSGYGSPGGGWSGIPRGGYDSQYPQTSMYGGTSIGGGRYIPRRKGSQYGQSMYAMQNLPMYYPPMYQGGYSPYTR